MKQIMPRRAVNEAAAGPVAEYAVWASIAKRTWGRLESVVEIYYSLERRLQ